MIDMDGDTVIDYDTGAKTERNGESTDTLTHILHNLQVNPNGEVRIDSSCGRTKRDLFENIEIRASSNSEWTFLAISRQNSSTPINPQKTSVATNMDKNWEATELAQCLFNPTSFFTSMEINYPMLITPLLLIPKALDFATVQQTYLSSSANMNVREGPRLARKEMVIEQTIDIQKTDFLPRSVLIAPPIIFQRRVEHSSTCPYSYSTTFIQQQHAKVLKGKCALPYRCPADVLISPETTMSCPGEAKTNGSVFGILPSSFDGQVGYSDFLFSLTDNPFLFREGRVQATRDFLDSSTESSKIILLFFTPEAGMTSVLTINANFLGEAVAKISVKLDHYEILEDAALFNYMALQILVLVNVLIIVLDIVFVLRGLWHDAVKMNESMLSQYPALLKLVCIL